MWMLALRGFARRLHRRPAEALLAAMLLALAVAPAVAVATLVVELFVRPLPFPDSRHLVLVSQQAPGTGLSSLPLSEAAYLLYRDSTHSLESMAAYHATAVNLAAPDGRPERISAVHASFDLPQVLGTTPAVGRWFTLDEDGQPAAPVVVISWSLWQRSFGGDSAVIGSGLRIDGETRQVVGVMPPSFAFPDVEARVWLPLGLDRASPDASAHWLRVVARLAPGQDLEQVSSELVALVPRLTELYPQSYPEEVLERWGFSMTAVPLAEHLSGRLRPALLSALAASLLLLLIASASSASILLARSESRRGELAVARVLGASRLQLFAESVTEPFLLALVGGAAGCGLAPFLLPVVSSVAVTQALPVEPHLAGAGVLVILAGLLLTAASVAVAAALPVLINAQRSPAHRLAERPGGVALRRVLVVGQLGLTLAIVSAESELVRRWGSLRSIEPGFLTDDVLTFGLSLPEAPYASQADVRTFVQRLLDRFESSPEVVDGGATTDLPLRGRRNLFALWVESPAGQPREQPETVPMTLASENYFESLGIPLLEGHPLSRWESGARSREVVVDRTFADRFWPGDSALGRRVATGSGEPLEVVGVVGSTRWGGVDRAPEPIVYFPLARLEGRAVTFVLRTRVEPEDALPTVRRIVAELDPEIPVAGAEPLSDLHRRSLGPLVPLARAVAAAALFAAILAISATAALLAALVLRRRRELALRFALGAHPVHVRRLILGEGMQLAIGGLLVGLATAALTTPLLRRALDFSDTLALWPHAVAALGLLASALLGAALPATLAGRIDPARALREE